jgi:hypothetical protein
MGRSAGAGSPIFLKCSQCRKHWPPASHASRGELRRTGRERPRRAAQGSALGTRNLRRSYECECGICKHVGWYSHRAVLQLPMIGDRKRCA